MGFQSFNVALRFPLIESLLIINFWRAILYNIDVCIFYMHTSCELVVLQMLLLLSLSTPTIAERNCNVNVVKIERQQHHHHHSTVVKIESFQTHKVNLPIHT